MCAETIYINFEFVSILHEVSIQRLVAPNERCAESRSYAIK